MSKRNYVFCKPDIRMSQQGFWVCTHTDCDTITYSIGDAVRHWTETHMPKRAKRKPKEKPFSQFSSVMGFDKQTGYLRRDK